MRNYVVPIYSNAGECKKKFITESARAAKTRSFDNGVEHNEEKRCLRLKRSRRKTTRRNFQAQGREASISSCVIASI